VAALVSHHGEDPARHGVAPVDRPRGAGGIAFDPDLRVRLQRDILAVAAAVTHRWSTGPVEGQVNRLKMITRQTAHCRNAAVH